MGLTRILRSLFFHVYIYTVTALLILMYAPSVVLPARVARRGFRQWGQATLWGLKTIVGLKVHVQGLDHRPQGGALVACKHQSMMETAVLFCLLDKPSMVLKKELTYVPFVGPLVRKAGLMVVDRKGGMKTLERLIAETKEKVDQGYQVIIFPEGTRRPVGAPASYKRGIAALYQKTGVACTPMALNTGLFWPRHKFFRYGGVSVFSFLKPIEAGVKKDVFMRRLSDQIEIKTDELVENALVNTI